MIRAVIEYRAAVLEDADAITETTRQGFASYAAFLPAGWTPPPAELEGARIRERLEEPDSYLRVALADGEIVAHTGFRQARTLEEPREPIPGLAHLFALFVREPFWGSGIAHELHAAVVEESARRGFARMRLLTPHGQARARAFYERRGWSTDGVAFFEAGLALDLVTYFRDLP